MSGEDPILTSLTIIMVIVVSAGVGWMIDWWLDRRRMR